MKFLTWLKSQAPIVKTLEPFFFFPLPEQRQQYDRALKSMCGHGDDPRVQLVAVVLAGGPRLIATEMIEGKTSARFLHAHSRD